MYKYILVKIIVIKQKMRIELLTRTNLLSLIFFIGIYKCIMCVMLSSILIPFYDDDNLTSDSNFI